MTELFCILFLLRVDATALRTHTTIIQLCIYCTLMAIFTVHS